MARNTENYEVVFEKLNKVALRKIEMPEPGPDEVLVRTISTLISTGTELAMLTGHYLHNPSMTWVEYPYQPGYCNAGEVIAKGSNVTKYNVGDIVATKGAHLSYYKFREGEKEGNFAGVPVVPKGVAPEEACFATIAAGVLNSVRIAETVIGDAVVVYGLGLLGQFACLWNRIAGAYPLIAVDISPERLELAKKFAGVEFAINGKEKNVKEEIKKITNGRMADIVFEVTGNAKNIPNEMEMLKEQAKFILLGSPRDTVEMDLHYLVNGPSHKIIGTHFGSPPQYETPYNQWTRPRNTELFIKLLGKKDISTASIITHRMSWKKSAEAFDLLLKDRTQAVGLVLDWRD
jgi:2-desacetyl-2-hydroxyethyl bacteriochlorophyllide A dehydrogenase